MQVQRFLEWHGGRAWAEAQNRSLITESRCLVPDIPERALNASFNGFRTKNGPKTHAVVNSVRHLLALAVTERRVNDHQPVEASCEAVREQKGESGRAMYADRNDTVEEVANDADFQGIGQVADQLQGFRGSVLSPLGRVIARSLGLVTRVRRQVKNEERSWEVWGVLGLAVLGMLVAATHLRQGGWAL